MRSTLSPLMIVATLAVMSALGFWTLRAGEAQSGGSSSADSPVATPADPAAQVIKLQVIGGMIANKSNEPYLQVFGDGRVVVTDRTTGNRKETKLSADELQALLKFVVRTKGFLVLDSTALNSAFMAENPSPIGDGARTIITVTADGKKNEVSFSSARHYSEQYPKIKLLADYVDVESRLFEVGSATERSR